MMVVPRPTVAVLCQKCRGAALLLLAIAGLLGSAAPARPDEFTDAAGRRVALPAPANRILPAERNAEVLVFVLAPDKLAAMSRRPLLARPDRLPVLGWGPRSTPASMAATARQVGADLIIDAGPVTPERAVFADQVQRQSGIPYVLVDDSFARMPAMLRALGAILGVGERADDLGLYAEHAIAGLRGRLLIRPANTRPRVYYALGRDGLTTALPGSPAGAAIDEAGAINVAAPLGRGREAAITPAQLSAWNPDIVIAEHRGLFDTIRRGATWRQLAAVQNKRVYLEPTRPYGWIEDPAGVNRLIGLYWLSSLFYPDATQEDLRSTTCDFYDKFYRIKLTNAQVEALVGPAGAPPPETPRPVGEPLVGLGAAPPSTLPPGTPGAVAPPSPAPSATPAPSAAPAVPGLPPGALGGLPQTGGGPNDTCSVPGAAAPSPIPLPGMAPTPGASPSEGLPPSAPPGMPPPGRRGRPPG